MRVSVTVFSLPYLYSGLLAFLMASLLLPAAQAQTATSVPRVQYGVASWYGAKFHGRRTANGEIYDMFRLTAAHRFAPLGIHAIVTNLETGRTIRVRINDRGPFVGRRILDLSYAAARRLGMVRTGTARVKVEFLPATVPIPTFIVQAGAYSDRNNAARAREALAAQYPKVWITVVRVAAQTLYRVRLGSFAKRERAEHVARQVQTLGYDSAVIPLLIVPPLVQRSADTL